MLSIDSLTVQRQGFDILKNLSLTVNLGQVMAILGRNGAGKTTLAEAICGLLASVAGTVKLGDVNLTGKTADQVLGNGVALVPEGGLLFPSMSVQENLGLGTKHERWWWAGPPDESFTAVWELFPDLHRMRDSKVSGLSGGQRRMVAIGRALMSSPTVLVLDEPSFGLSPKMVDAVAGHILELSHSGIAIVLMEQNIDLAFEVASEAALLNGGGIRAAGSPDELAKDPDFVATLFGSLST